MRADHPKLWHPIRITIVVITVWWILFCLLLAPTDNPAAIVWTIIEIAMLLLSPFFPKSMSLLFLIMSQSGPWLIPGADVNSLPGILYTFGMLAYETNNLVALLLLAYSIGDQLFRRTMHRCDVARRKPRRTDLPSRRRVWLPRCGGVYARSASTSPRSSMWRAVRQAPPRAWPESPMICFARPTPTSRVMPSPAAKPTCR